MTKKWLVFPIILAMAAVLAAPVWAKDISVDSKWAPVPIRVDGNDLDWQNVTMLTDEGSGAQYAVENDGQNLYILFVFKDAMSASTIDYTGMKIFFDAEGRRSKDLGISFTRRDVKADELIASLEKRGQVLTDERKAEIRKQGVFHLFEANVVNKKKVPAPSDPAFKNQPPMYEVGVEHRARVYEFRIPLSRINEAGGIGSEPGKTVKLGFEWGGLTSQIMESMLAGQPMQSGMERQDVGLGGSIGSTREQGGGLQGGSDLRRDPRTRLHSFWVDVKLAASGS
jgi:hypothetical protein